MSFNSSKDIEDLMCELNKVLVLLDSAKIYNKAKHLLETEKELWGIPSYLRAYNMLIVSGVEERK